MSLTVRYSYLSILPDDNADNLAASFSISYCGFSSQNFSSVVMISFDILSERLLLKCKGLPNVRLVSLTKKEYGLTIYSLYRFRKLKLTSDE